MCRLHQVFASCCKVCQDRLDLPNRLKPEADARCCPEVDVNDWDENVTFNNFSPLGACTYGNCVASLLDPLCVCVPFSGRLASDDLEFSVSIQIPGVLDFALVLVDELDMAMWRVSTCDHVGPSRRQFRSPH